MVIPAEPRSLSEGEKGKPIILMTSFGIVLQLLPEVRSNQRERSAATMMEKHRKNILRCRASRQK